MRGGRRRPFWKSWFSLVGGVLIGGWHYSVFASYTISVVLVDHLLCCCCEGLCMYMYLELRCSDSALIYLEKKLLIS